MWLFFIFGVFTSTVTSAPCPQQNITITGQRWIMLRTAAMPNTQCVYAFTFPSHQYAVLAFTATDVNPSDVIIAGNDFGDSFQTQNSLCTSNCDTMTSTTSWPSEFNVSYTTRNVTNMKLQITVTLYSFKPRSNIVGAITTVKDGQSSVIYFQDWKAGTSYTIAPKDGTLTAEVSLHLAIAFKNVYLERPNLNNIFVYEEEKNVGTLAHGQFVPLKSRNKVTLYAASTINLRGAVFITDEANVRPLFYAYATYVPVYAADSSAMVGISAELHPARAGAVTVIGDKDGSTPITVRQLSGSAANGTFSYLVGGPIDSHANYTTPLETSDLPKKFSGNVNTFYLTKGTGSLIITIPSH